MSFYVLEDSRMLGQSVAMANSLCAQKNGIDLKLKASQGTLR